MPIQETGVFAWENQTGQYPMQGKGIQYFRANIDDGRWVDCLFYYGDDSTLQGILNFYPFNFQPFQKKGGVNIQVRKDKRKQGIASALMTEAMKSFEINPMKQDYLPLGKNFIKNYRFAMYKSVLQSDKHSSGCISL